MNVQVKYFAVLRELIGASEEEISLEQGASVAQLLEALCARYPQLKGYTDRVAIAIDHQYANHESTLYEGAEVALLPPVAGGQDDEIAASTQPTPASQPGLIASSEDGLLQLREDPLDTPGVVASVRGDFAGAIVTFEGIIREQSQGRQVRYLEYEAYPPMVISELQRIATQVHDQWPSARLGVHHRVGTLQIGESAVVIAVCTPHRQEAFAACSFTIERLKESVPIWKKEFFTDGTTWVGWGP